MRQTNSFSVVYYLIDFRLERETTMIEIQDFVLVYRSPIRIFFGILQAQQNYLVLFDIFEILGSDPCVSK